MPFKAKCPACGRKQSLDESDIGNNVWCLACGNQFLVETAPVEAESPHEPPMDSDSARIPDIDFPADFGLGTTGIASPAAMPSPATASNPALLPSQLPVQPSALTQMPASTPGQANLSISTPVSPQPIVHAPQHSNLVPILIGLVAVMSIALAGGLIAILYLLNRPASLPVSASAIQTTPPGRPVVSIPAKPSSLQTPMAVPATEPAQVDAPVVSYVPKPSPKPEPVAIPEPVPVEVQVPKFRPVPVVNPEAELDDQIGTSIDNGVNYLLAQFANGKLKVVDNSARMGSGMDALAVYALLQAGEATHDPRLGPNTPAVASLLDALKGLSMDNDDATYSHSLRAAALSVYHRPADRPTLKADAAWLISASTAGAYTYGLPAGNRAQPLAPSRFRFSGAWDNSNSQYGALGVWAALEAGVEIPNSYWQAVEKHWLSCQLPDGEWAYTGYGDMGRMSMTVAGITTLLVAEDQLGARAVVANLGHPPFAPALLHGLNWLEAGNNSIRLPANWRTYALFGLERAALASGFKYFGTHDWYRELAREQIKLQQADGSWTGDNEIVDTAYTLLFLSRGRHPIFMNKLRFDGYWANRPRDIANLTHYATTVLERPINWQVVSLKSSWTDWMDSPVLYIAGHEALKLTDEDCDKLRAFAQNGGLIFTHADGDSQPFTKAIAELSKRLFPQYALDDLPTTHPIFSTLYKIKLQPKLQGISNGSRLLLVHSPTDLNKTWQQRDWTQRPVNFQMGINIFIYAAGKQNLRNKLKTPLAPEVTANPIQTTTIAQLKYKGDYNPEPAGLPRFARLFFAETSVKVNVIDAVPSQLDPSTIPLAHFTGTGAMSYDPTELRAIHDYVDHGGILVVDCTNASSVFLKSMLLDFFPHAFGQSRFTDMPGDYPILTGTGAGTTPVSLKLRPFRTELDGTTQQPIQFFTLGKGMVIFSPIDLTTAYLGTSTWGVNGYEPAGAYALTRNLLLSALER